MNLNKILAVGMTAILLVGCSANTTSSTSSNSSSNTEELTRVEINYDEIYDVSDISMNEDTFHGISYEKPASIASRKLTNGSDTLTYLMRGQNDRIEVHFEEVGSTDEDIETFISTMDTNTYCDVVSYGKMTIGEVSGYYVEGVTNIYGTVISQGNCDMYIVPSDNGIVIIRISLDAYGSIDYAPVYDHLVQSVKIA